MNYSFSTEYQFFFDPECSFAKEKALGCLNSLPLPEAARMQYHAT